MTHETPIDLLDEFERSPLDDLVLTLMFTFPNKDVVYFAEHAEGLEKGPPFWQGWKVQTEWGTPSETTPLLVVMPAVRDRRTMAVLVNVVEVVERSAATYKLRVKIPTDQRIVNEMMLLGDKGIVQRRQ